MIKKSVKVISEFSQSFSHSQSFSQGSLSPIRSHIPHTQEHSFPFLSQRSVCLRAYSYILQIYMDNSKS